MELSSSPETSLPKIVTDCDLPEGWQRLQVTRNGGASRGKIDTYYIDPVKKKYRSKVQLIKYFGDSYDLSDFDYRTGKMIKSSPNNSPQKTANLLTTSPNKSVTGWRSNGTSPTSSSSLASLCSSNGSRKSSVTSSPATSSPSVLTKAKSPRPTSKTTLAKATIAASSPAPTSGGGSPSVPPQSLLLAMSPKAPADTAPVSLAPTSAAKTATKRKLDLNKSSSPKRDQNGSSDAVVTTTTKRKSGTSLSSSKSSSVNGLGLATVLTPEKITDAILTTLNIKDGFHLPGNLSVSEIILKLAKRIVDTPDSLRTDSGQPIVVQRVTEDDIRAQEAVVEQYRRQLSEAIAGGPSN